MVFLSLYQSQHGLLTNFFVLSKSSSLSFCSLTKVKTTAFIASRRKKAYYDNIVTTHSSTRSPCNYFVTKQHPLRTTTTRTTSSNSTVNTIIRKKRIATTTTGMTLIVMGCGLVVGYFHSYFDGIEGLTRSIKFYSYAIPKYITYRYHCWNQSPDHIWDELDQKTSITALQKIYELEGFYIKLGQLVASNVGNGFPIIWQNTMSILQDKCPPKDYNTVIKPIIEREIPNYQDIFEYIDPIPIGSASIGQVHRARLKKEQVPVVIKICYPNVERLLRGDVRTVKTFAQIALPVYVPVIEEIEKQFRTEFNYVIEGQHLEMVRKNLEKEGLAGHDKPCIIPKSYIEYCTKHVLVMEEIKGEKIAVALQKDVQKLAKQAGITVEEFHQQQRKKQEEYKRLGQVYLGPSVSDYNRMISYLSKKNRLYNMFVVIYNNTIGFIIPKTRFNYRMLADEIPFNHAKLVDDLIYIHGHEVLIDGHFNGDPHPGNILLLHRSKTSRSNNNNNNNDSNINPHQLGLIDYGQVSIISKETRHLFCKLIIALADDNRSEIIQIMKEAGYQSQYMNHDVMYLTAKVYFDEDNEYILDGKHIQLFMEDLQRRDPIIQLPYQFIPIARASVLLRGLAHVLHQSRSVATIWKPIAERVLQEDI